MIADTFPRLVINNQAESADWSVTRMTKNAQSKQGVQSPTSGDIRCYTSQTAPNVADVGAGATIHYISTQQINHPGPTQYYLAKVPAGSTVKTWDGSGAVWFKFHTEVPATDSRGQVGWKNQSTYPPCVLDRKHLVHKMYENKASVREENKGRPCHGGKTAKKRKRRKKG
jgi:hypothetical protein